MIYFRTGSQAHRLVTLLSVVGEFPSHSLHLLGNERVYKALVRKLTTVQTIRNPQTETEMTCRLLTISGKGSAKSIRLYKAALPILTWICPEAYAYYMRAFRNHNFPGDMSHWERNHRVAEAAAMCMRAGLEFRPYILPKLQNESIMKIVPDEPVFYLARALKQIGQTEMKKTMFTRLTGVIFNNKSCYAVYNTRNAVMKWSGMGEFKTLHSIIEAGRLNAAVTAADSAILFGESDRIALETLLASDKTKRFEFRFDSIYRHVYYVPMNDAGIAQLKILSVPDWNRKLLELLFDAEDLSNNAGLFEYDAYVNGVYILSHLDGDIARLIRFKQALAAQQVTSEILCFPHQTHFVREYMGNVVRCKEIKLDSVLSEL